MNKFDFGNFKQEPVDEFNLFPDASSNRTNLLENFAHELPAPDGGKMANKGIIFNKARSPELEAERLEVADRYLEEDEKKRLIEEAVQDEVDNFQNVRRFSEGFIGGYGNAISGGLRMMGNDTGADMVQSSLRDPQIQMNQQKLMEMARKSSPAQADILEEELEESFVGDLFTAGGQVVGQVTAVGGATAVAGPVGGGAMLTGLVVGNNFEGNYNRSLEERTTMLFESYQKEGRAVEPDILEQEIADIKQEAKGDAYRNLPSVIPELALEAIFMKGVGHLFRGQAGSTFEKVATFTIGSLAEGSSEALSTGLQNYMVKNNINPEQEISEGMLRDFALGTIIGSTVNLASGIGGEFDSMGQHSILGDIEKLQKDIYKRAVKDGKDGDKLAQQYVEDYNNAVESIIVEENGDVIKSVSTKGASNDTGGMSQQAILKIVQKQMGKSDLDIHVVDTLANASKIDDSLEGKLEGQEGIEGMYLNKSKKIILVADQLNTEADVSRVLRHESIGHLGTEMVTGPMQNAFYNQVGRDYVNTSVGKQILRDYASDPNFTTATLGKEIVARVSENHENADYSFKRSIIDTFNSLTNKKFKDSPENDKNILKSIRLAEATLNSPGLSKKLNQPVESQTEEVLLSKGPTFNFEQAELKEDAKIARGNYPELGQLGDLVEHIGIEGDVKSADNIKKLMQEPENKDKLLNFLEANPVEVSHNRELKEQSGEAFYEITDGNHRYELAQMAGIKDIPVSAKSAREIGIKTDDVNFSKKPTRVVDKEGEPLTVFHGSTQDFDKFDEQKINPADPDAPFNGFWFTSNKEGASPAFSNPRFIKSFNLNIENPAPPEVYRELSKEFRQEDLRKELEKRGYDGVKWDGDELIPTDDPNKIIIKSPRMKESEVGSRYLLKQPYEAMGPNNDVIRGDSWDLFQGNEEITGYLSPEDYMETSGNNETWVAFNPNQIERTSDKNFLEETTWGRNGTNFIKDSSYHKKAWKEINQNPKMSVEVLQEVDTLVADDYLESFDHDSTAGEVSDVVNNNKQTTTSRRMVNLLKALERDDYLGFDKPIQAIEAILSEDPETLFENFDISPQLKAGITNYTYSLLGPQKNEVNFSKKGKNTPDKIPSIINSYHALQAGQISQKEYNNSIDKFKPVLPYDSVPKPATVEEMQGALKTDQVKTIGIAQKIFKPGQKVGIRLDIPAYLSHNVWVPTMHGKGKDGKNVAVNDSVAHLKNADLSTISEPTGKKIMEGERSKTSYARINGDYIPADPKNIKQLADKAINDPAWTQVGMDPHRHSYFYNRKDHGKKILHADEILQIGPLVLAKNATFATHETVAYSRKAKQQSELKEGMTRDKDGNIFYEGVPPREWTPEIFKEVGDLYGIKNFGGLSNLTTITDPDSGEKFKLPGGLDGKFTYYDMLWIKNNQPDITNISEKLHGQITKKLSESLTPEKIDKIDHFNRLAFGFLSPNAPLLPNEFGLARIFARDESGIQRLADLAKTIPPQGDMHHTTYKGVMSRWNKKAKAQFDIGSKKDGALGIGLSQDFSRLANFARLYLKNPDFFIKKDDESWSSFVNKVASQTTGFGTKTASFGGVWQDPYNAMISAIDRHMANGFAERVIKDESLKSKFEKTIVGAFNTELTKSRKRFGKYQKRLKVIDKDNSDRLKKATTEKQKLTSEAQRQRAINKADGEWNAKVAEGVDPKLKKVKTLDDVFAQEKSFGSERIQKAIGKATFATMSAKTPVFRNAVTGILNDNLKGTEWENFNGFIETPSNLKLMTDAYAKAVEINEEKANELGIPIFPAQWTLWDRIRKRIEPHEIMFPGLNKLPRMGRKQIAESYASSATAGYNIAPQSIEPTGMKPEEMVYFSKKPGSKVDPVTGESKLLVRLKADQDLAKEIRDELELEYEVQGHPEVMRKLKPWYDKFKGKKAEDMYVSLTSDEASNMEPEAKMMASTVVLKRLSKQADLVRNRKTNKNSPGQMNLDGFSNSNKFDDMAIDLAMRMSEEARSHGRAISVLQELGNLNATSLYKFSRNQIAKTTQARVNRKLPEHGEVSNELMDLIKVAREAGFDQMSIEFLRKSAPDLVKAIEKQFAPSLWGAYRKGAVDKLHKRLVAKLNKNHKEGNSNTHLAKFTNELITEIGKRTGLNADGSKRKPRPRSDVLRDALLNAEKYTDVWRDLAEQTLNDESLTAEQFTELQEFFGRMPLDPSGKLMDSTMQERMKALDVKLKELARKHLDTQNRSRDGLVKELMFELDLPASMAQQISTRFISQFNRTMVKERSSQLKKFKETQLGKKVSKKAKSLDQKIIELSNLGAFSDTDMYSALAQMLGVKGGVTKEFSRKIMDASNKVQKAPEGFQKTNATQDLLNIIQNQAGDGVFATMLAIRVANLVSGPSTQVINLTGNLFTALPMQAGNLARGGTTSPRLGYEMGLNMLHGLSKGWSEAQSIMSTGRGRAGFEMDKYAFDPVLERLSAKNPFSYLKYVHRFMSSMDALFRFSNIEGKASFLAHMEGKQMGKRGSDLTQYVMEALRGSESMRQGAEAQATTEGLTGLNKQRRVNEIIESNRSQEIKTESEHFGLRTTFQNKPEGMLGAFASLVAQASYPMETVGQDVPLSKQALSGVSQFAMPFIRVVANVQNMTFDFTPGLGAVRALWHKHGGARVTNKGSEMTTEAYKDMHMRHLMGCAVAGVFGHLFFREEEDEENRMFDVTGPGPTNYAKKKSLMASNWKPHTITIMGHQFGYKETPFGGLLAFMGGMKDQAKYDDEPANLGNQILAGTMAYGTLMKDQSFFKGMSDILDILKFDDRSISKAKTVFSQAPSQFLVPNLFYQVDAMMSNKKYPDGDLQSSIGFYLQPLVPGARSMGMPDLGPLGKPMERYNNQWPANILSRVYDGPAEEGPLGDLIRHKVIPTVPSQSTKIRENDDELSDLHRAQDLYLYNYYKGTKMRELVTNKDQPIAEMESDVVQMYYKKLERKVSRYAKGKVLRQNRKEVSQDLKKIKKILDRNP